MPEHIRALVVILGIAIFIFSVAKPAFSSLLLRDEFVLFRNLWLALTLTVFLSGNFWLYITISALLVFVAQRGVSDKTALFLMLLFALPLVSSEISGFGVLKHLFAINGVRLLELLLLLPMYATLVADTTTKPFGRSITDKFVAMFLILTVVLEVRATTLTDTIRFAFYSFIDIFLPYYVASRSLRRIEQFRTVLACLIIGCLLLGGVAIFENLKGWLLYGNLNRVLGVSESAISAYLLRDGVLRASGTTGQAIVLGYVMMVGIGFFAFIGQRIGNLLLRNLLFAILVGGLFASISRGPWVGTVIFFLVFIMFGEWPVQNMIKVAIGGVLALGIVLALPVGEKITRLLPFVGSVDSSNVDYRERLIENGLAVFQHNPFFGSVNYLDTPEMQSMKQGQGIIDVVNSYVGILLQYGLVGLLLFVGVFASVLWSVYRILRRFKSKANEHYLLGRTMFAVLVAILITIYTVSSISFIPILYWIIAGMGVAYVQMFAKTNVR
jgi:O-antigen ligase